MGKLAITNSLAIGSTIEKYRDQIVSAIGKTYAEYPALNRVEQ